MRPGLAVALLLSVAGLAGVVHWDQQGRPPFWRPAHAAAPAEHAFAAGPRPAAQVPPPPPGWVSVVLGAPSGAAPLYAEAPVHEAELEAPALQRSSLPDFQVIVRPGQVLNRIARDHYGHDADWLVEALAAYNGLRDADSLEVGQTLLLPETEKLTR